MSDLDAVLFANESFYHAFTNGDFAAMNALWAQAAPVCCIHPGWEALTERSDIMESWQAILSGDNAPQIRCLEPQVFFYGDSAFVVCFEGIGNDFLIATNYFVREDGRWRMTHHQAGPTRYVPGATANDEARSIN